MKTILQKFSVDYSFPVVFTQKAFSPGNEALLALFPKERHQPHRVAVVVDEGVAQATPRLEAAILDFFLHHRDRLELAAPVHYVPGGEACKEDRRIVDNIHLMVKDYGLCRHSYIMAIGGGAVLDTIGYAAATAHRGVRLIRLPTTTLAQNDAGVGVKNAVNAFGRKNFIGTFAPPYAVVNDFSFLETLPERERRGGFAEAVKVAMIRDRRFFRWLVRNRHALRHFDRQATRRSIVRCADLHLQHIRSGDPFEMGSARPLDFGHWSAHRLEELSHGKLRHGEAVAIGIALDTLYAARLNLLHEEEAVTVLGLLEDLGFNLWDYRLADFDLSAALEGFREHLGGELALTLPGGIGHGIEVGKVDAAEYRRCIETLWERTRKRGFHELSRADVSHRDYQLQLS